MIDPISSANVPAPFGPYSTGAQIGCLVQVSGQLGIDVERGTLAGESVYEQTVQALDNIRSVLSERNLGFDDVLVLRVQVGEPSMFVDVNSAMEAVLAAPFPARTTLYGGLPPTVLVEIDALAVVT